MLDGTEGTLCVVLAASWSSEVWTGRHLRRQGRGADATCVVLLGDRKEGGGCLGHGTLNGYTQSC